jgi:hypothetical protein
MINKTTESILVDSNKSASDLSSTVRNAISYTIDKEAQHLGSLDGKPVMRAGKHAPTFAFFFEDELSKNYTYDKSFIEAAYKVSQTSFIADQKALPEIATIFVDNPTMSISGVGLEAIRKGLRTVLLYLWSRQTILLPITFKVHSSIDKYVYEELLTEVAAYFWKGLESLKRMILQQL